MLDSLTTSISKCLTLSIVLVVRQARSKAVKPGETVKRLPEAGVQTQRDWVFGYSVCPHYTTKAKSAHGGRAGRFSACGGGPLPAGRPCRAAAPAKSIPMEGAGDARRLHDADEALGVGFPDDFPKFRQLVAGDDGHQHVLLLVGERADGFEQGDAARARHQLLQQRLL